MELYFGLGMVAVADRVEVTWLDGSTTVATGMAAGSVLQLSPAGGR